VQAAWVLIGVAVVALLVAQALERRTHSEAT
jgi:hypothetical protein